MVNTETSTEELTIAEILVCFLNENAIPNVTSIENTVIKETGIENTNIDNSFINKLSEKLTEECNWKEEKVEIFLAIKSYFSRYINATSVLNEKSMTFQDFYEKLLGNLIHLHFREIKEGKSDITVLKINALEDYIDKCFNIFKQDSLYIQINKQSSVIETFTQNINDLNTKQEDITNAVNTANTSIEQQTQKVAETSITILGIFVGIVMVFFGGFTILDSVAVGLFTASPYRLIFTLLAFGAILYNVVVLLFYLIGKLTHKTIICECQKYTPIDETTTKSGQKEVKCTNCKCCAKFAEVCRLRYTMPYIYWGNVVIAALMLFIFCMYALKGITFGIKVIKISQINTFLLINQHFMDTVTLLQVILSCVITLCFVIFCGYFGRAKSKNRLKKAEQKVLKRQTKKIDKSKNKQYCENNFLKQIHVNFAKMLAYFKKFTIKRNKKIEIVKKQEDDNTNQMIDKETLDINDKNDDTDVAE